MFEVSYTNEAGNKVRHVAKEWAVASELAKNAVKQYATRVSIRRMRTEVWIVGFDGSLHRVIGNANPTDAAKWARDWTLADRSNGCLLWPEGQKLPKKLTG